MRNNNSTQVSKEIDSSNGNWHYSPVMIVASGQVHHAGCYLAREIVELLSNYKGEVEFAKLNGSPVEFLNARSCYSFLIKQVQSGDEIIFRFNHGGKKMRADITHLERLVCRNSF